MINFSLAVALVEVLTPLAAVVDQHDKNNTYRPDSDALVEVTFADCLRAHTLLRQLREATT